MNNWLNLLVNNDVNNYKVCHKYHLWMVLVCVTIYGVEKIRENDRKRRKIEESLRESETGIFEF